MWLEWSKIFPTINLRHKCPSHSMARFLFYSSLHVILVNHHKIQSHLQVVCLGRMEFQYWDYMFRKGIIWDYCVRIDMVVSHLQEYTDTDWRWSEGNGVIRIWIYDVTAWSLSPFSLYKLLLIIKNVQCCTSQWVLANRFCHTILLLWYNTRIFGIITWTSGIYVKS